MLTRDTLLLGAPMTMGAFLIGVSVWACFLNLTDTMSAQPWVLRVASVAGPASLGLGLIKVAADLAKARDVTTRLAAARIEARLDELQRCLLSVQETVEVLAARQAAPDMAHPPAHPFAMTARRAEPRGIDR
ncbi:hypothetical protein ACE7GA_04870 [Roseomonas sp. CCTCC AB2023176]|uniref:hypothetical protein n=1 Tax=Roseomonas sp. CCTCC AB2023176 TaxID=3342640 RepID=UPI0035E14205